MVPPESFPLDHVSSAGRHGNEARADDRPLVSVVMPVYNGQAFIAEAAESILGQTEADLELIIVDDGSIDHSAEIAAEIAARDQRVRLVRLGHAGNVAAANEGIRLARGQFIAKMDADDISLPGRVAAQVRHLRQNPDTVGVGGATIALFPDDSCGEPIQWPLHQRFSADSLLQWIGMPGPGAMMRAETLRTVGGFRGAFVLAQDADLWRRLIEVGDIDNLAEPILLYRRHPAQVSSRFGPLQKLYGDTATALAHARADGGEPDWKSDEPLSPEVVRQLAEKCSPRAATLLHVALARYLAKEGLLADAKKHCLCALNGDPSIIRQQPVFNVLWRVAVKLLLNGQAPTLLALLTSNPAGLVGCIGGRIKLWAAWPISPAIVSRLRGYRGKDVVLASQREAMTDAKPAA